MTAAPERKLSSEPTVRWGEAENRLLADYLQDGRLDLERVVGSASYLSHLKQQETVWNRHSNKNFNQNVRRTLSKMGVTNATKSDGTVVDGAGCNDCICAKSCPCDGACVPT